MSFKSISVQINKQADVQYIDYRDKDKLYFLIHQFQLSSVTVATDQPHNQLAAVLISHQSDQGDVDEGDDDEL